MQVVIDNQDTAHNGLLAAPFPTQALMALIPLQRIRCTSLISAANSHGVCPLPGIANTYAKCGFAKLQRKIYFNF
jgi:hypothetical protein